MITALEKVMHKHDCRGFKITDMHAENEFDKVALMYFLQPTLLHICGRDEHVAFIDRSVRKTKERLRSTCSAMLFRRITMPMVRFLVEVTTDVRNEFPSKNGIS